MSFELEEKSNILFHWVNVDFLITGSEFEYQNETVIFPQGTKKSWICLIIIRSEEETTFDEEMFRRRRK